MEKKRKWASFTHNLLSSDLPYGRRFRFFSLRSSPRHSALHPSSRPTRLGLGSLRFPCHSASPPPLSLPSRLFGRRKWPEPSRSWVVSSFLLTPRAATSPPVTSLRLRLPSVPSGACGARIGERVNQRKVDRVLANHSLSSTASQGRSNIPLSFLLLGLSRQARRSVPEWKTDGGNRGGGFLSLTSSLCPAVPYSHNRSIVSLSTWQEPRRSTFLSHFHISLHSFLATARHSLRSWGRRERGPNERLTKGTEDEWHEPPLFRGLCFAHSTPLRRRLGRVPLVPRVPRASGGYANKKRKILYYIISLHLLNLYLVSFLMPFNI